jgi:GNAT superfamily N-acetyltransferase
MHITLRPPTAADVEPCGRILFDAFVGVAQAHGFEPDFPSVEMTTGLVRSLFQNPGAYSVVAQADDGRVVGSNFLDEQDEVKGVGPISVDPTLQGAGIGRMLMQAVLTRAGNAPVRLLQDAFNMPSLSLYTSLGFDIREPLVVAQGKPTSAPVPGARPLMPADVPACRQLSLKVLGLDRSRELANVSPDARPWVFERDGRITAYATGLHMWVVNHGVAETTEDLQALLLGFAAGAGDPLWFILPTRQAALLRWCLREGLRITKPMTLMTLGHYQEPAGAWLPSVLF